MLISILLYNIGVRAYLLAIWGAQFFNKKAKLWIIGRRNWQQRYAADWQQKNPEGKPCIWVHCASLGEFEQGRPVIERLHREYPQYKILLTFFSPSGYIVRQRYVHADYICYLPADSPRNARIFVELFKPIMAIFVKYEYWLHFLNALHKKGAPTLLISGIFSEDQIFFKWYGALFRKALSGFHHIFVQNSASADLLKSLKIKSFSIAGDTRVDRVMQISREATELEFVDEFANNHRVLVAGSTWPPDEAILATFINQDLPDDWKVIIAPHHISENHLIRIERALELPLVRYSELTPINAPIARILLIDNVGMLARLYRYGRLAYIGGGFGAGIHNTLEPIAFRLPVICGPNKHEHFEETRFLTAKGGAFIIHNAAALFSVFVKLANESTWTKASETAYQYVLNNQGATHKIVQLIKDHKLLTIKTM